MSRGPKIYKVRRRSVVILWPLFYLSLCVGLIAFPSFILAALIGDMKIVPSERYLGELTTDQDPIVVNLPANTMISEVLVARGQDVRAGETVATFDKSALKATRERLENETAALVLERRCLLDPSLFEAFEETAFDTSNELDQLLSIGLQSCRLHVSSFGPQRVDLHKERVALVENRAEILKRQQSLLGQIHQQEVPQMHQQILFAALQLQQHINQADADDNAVRTELHALTVAESEARLQRLNTLSDEIASNNMTLERVEVALDSPRLLSPVTGKVQRVRAIQRGTILTDSVELLQITPTENAAYVVKFPVDFDAAHQIVMGERILIRPLGVRHADSLNLLGRVSGFSTTIVNLREQVTLVNLTLDDESVARLQDPDIRLSLHGTSTASVVEIKRAERAIADEIEQTWDQNCQNFAQALCRPEPKLEMTNAGVGR